MKKVINITIGKTVFLIEEDAFHSLETYLNEIRNHFAKDEESIDVLEDLEKLAENGFSFFSLKPFKLPVAIHKYFSKIILIMQAVFSDSTIAIGFC